MLTGHYTMLAMTLNALRVQPDTFRKRQSVRPHTAARTPRHVAPLAEVLVQRGPPAPIASQDHVVRRATAALVVDHAARPAPRPASRPHPGAPIGADRTASLTDAASSGPVIGRGGLLA